MSADLDAAIEAWRRAVETSDVDAAADVLDDAFALRSFGGVAPEMSRDEWLATLPEIESRSFELEEVDVREFGDVAVVASRGTWDASRGERDLSGVYALTDVYVRRDGNWLATWRVSTRLPG